MFENSVRELLYSAAKHYKRGKELSSRGDTRGALGAYKDALRDLHAVKPQRQRDVLLAHVYLSRYQLAIKEPKHTKKQAEADLRMGYSYARSTQEMSVRQLAENLWQEHLAARKQPLLTNPRF